MKTRNHHVLVSVLCLLFCGLCTTLLWAESSEATGSTASYHLGSGDKLKITIFNQEDMNGEYTVDGTGNVSLPLIGTIAAKNLTLNEFENKLKGKLSPDYLLNPKIAIQVLNYRPFYILGEVKSPSSYPYVSGMSYLTAVAIAGGFSYRAKESAVYVIHASNPEQKEIETKLEESVQPGDIIRVDERFF
ncbi:MAG: polysaccharide export protein [Gammaproteobacteria bacterium]|nr:polysaccharide export protein [Gammaproteobacteria bacterium]